MSYTPNDDYLYLFHVFSFVVTSREENKSCILTECICNQIVIFLIEISVSVLRETRYSQSKI